MQSFFSTFSSNISPDDIIVLAISGGVDSMVLFDMISHIHPKANTIVAHLDHSLRWVESDWDRELVASICKRENIIFEVTKLDIANIAKTEKSSLEAIARRERYAFLESVRMRYNARYILTAHHAVDQTETIIGNMVKGAKVRWLSGMNMVSRTPLIKGDLVSEKNPQSLRDSSFAKELTGTILRPLLTTTKSEILEYARENQVEYREDSSNMDTTYDRNRIRHDIIPVLESLNPSIHNTFAELASYMQSLGDFFTDTVESWLRKSELESWKPNTFLIASFLALSPFLQGEIISYLYNRAQDGSSQWLSRGLTRELIRFIWDPASYGVKEIKSLKLERRGERIVIVI